MFPRVSPQVCRSMAANYILLSPLQTTTAEVEKQHNQREAEVFASLSFQFYQFFFSWFVITV